MTDRKVEEKKEAERLETREGESGSAQTEGLESMDDLIRQQRRDMAEQKNPDRPPRFTSEKFGRPEIVGLEEGGQRPGLEQESTTITFSDGRKGLLQSDGSIAVVSPKEGNQETTTFYKNREDGQKHKVDRVEIVYDPGQPEGIFKKVDFREPSEHSGRRMEYYYSNRDDGKYQHAEFDTNVTKDRPIGGYRGLASETYFDSDKNENGLKMERTFNPRHSGGVLEVREYDPEKSGGITTERTMANSTVYKIYKDGTVRTFDRDGKEQGKPKKDDTPPPAPDNDPLED